MEEKVFHDSGAIKVTATRFMVDGGTYPIANISSVKSATKPASRAFAGILTVIGAFTLLGGLTAPDGARSAAIGIILLGLGIWLWRRAKPKYSVVLTTAGTEKQALESNDKQLIEGVIAALNDAIVHRG